MGSFLWNLCEWTLNGDGIEGSSGWALPAVLIVPPSGGVRPHPHPPPLSLAKPSQQEKPLGWEGFVTGEQHPRAGQSPPHNPPCKDQAHGTNSQQEPSQGARSAGAVKIQECLNIPPLERLRKQPPCLEKRKLEKSKPFSTTCQQAQDLCTSWRN